MPAGARASGALQRPISGGSAALVRTLAGVLLAARRRRAPGCSSAAADGRRSRAWGRAGAAFALGFGLEFAGMSGLRWPGGCFGRAMVADGPRAAANPIGHSRRRPGVERPPAGRGRTRPPSRRLEWAARAARLAPQGQHRLRALGHDLREHPRMPSRWAGLSNTNSRMCVRARPPVRRSASRNGAARRAGALPRRSAPPPCAGSRCRACIWPGRRAPVDGAQRSGCSLHGRFLGWVQGRFGNGGAACATAASGCSRVPPSHSVMAGLRASCPRAGSPWLA